MRPAFRFIARPHRAWSALGLALQSFDEQDIAWQITVITAEYQLDPEIVRPAGGAAWSVRQPLRADADAAPTKEIFVAEADKIAEELSRYAIRRGPSAAWIGLDWLGDSEVFQLVCLGRTFTTASQALRFFSPRMQR